jgi:chemotaxis response regulator CheB
MTRVLVVDKDASIRSTVAELLDDEGYVVDTAGNDVHGFRVWRLCGVVSPDGALVWLIGVDAEPLVDRWCDPASMLISLPP